MYIKLSKPASPTRRLAFQAAPDWHSLSTRVSELYHIPQPQVALGYIDASDGGLVTLNSDEELAQCLSNISTDDTARFVVQDLRTVPFHALSTHNDVLASDTYTGNPLDEDDPEWVDVSDPLIQPSHEIAASLIVEDPLSPSCDKSPGSTVQSKAYEDYVVDLISHEVAHERASVNTLTPQNLLRIEDRPLPMATASDANTEYDDGETSIQSEPEEYFPHQRRHRTPSCDSSLVSDLTMLVSALSSASSCHPEITIGLFNLISNTKSGTYWPPLKRDVRRFASKAASEGIIAAQAICTEGIRAAAEARTHGLEMDERMRSAREAMKLEAELRISEAMGAVMREFGGFDRPPSP